MNNDISLGIQSEYVVNHLHTQTIERDAFVVYQTPDSPNYYFGNLLALKEPLSSRSKQDWEACFDRQFRSIPGIQHRTFVWRHDPDAHTTALVDAFKSSVYVYGEEHILSMASNNLVVPDPCRANVEVRRLSTESDWLQWLEVGVASRDEGHAEEDFRRFRQSRLEVYRALIEQDNGRFFGAFDGERLVGYAGVFHHSGLARFQDVEVIPEYRRRGIARTLISELSQWVGQYADQQVIVADAHYHATVLYQSLGFRVTQIEANLCWWPRS